ncbi:UNVERIFIED_CONTAM: ELMO domain-containing protein 1 [Trichonephila clavipes]
MIEEVKRLQNCEISSFHIENEDLKELMSNYNIFKQRCLSGEHVLRITKIDEYCHPMDMLWALLNPDKPLQSRISKQWTEIGFQGDDPKTDFRGMGILGLENLLYFATEHCEAARHVLLHSNHPNYGYSFAIVGINLTSMAYDMLKNQSLQVHFYNSYLFYEFDKFWLSEKPRDIMEFSRIRAKFQTKILKQLENPKTQLKLNIILIP